ncbi:MAG: hypothetical protein IPK07_31615 [Deltaproteobacteria bacterium]|nr:hypothetical protein [Deltaproteobacteria bacterium]
MLKRNIAGLVLLAVASGCASSTLYEGIQISAVSDPKVNVKGLRTYEWAIGASIMRDTTAAWQAPDFDVNDEFGFLIEKELRDRGMRPVNKNPDVYVGFLIVANVEQAKLVRDKAGDLNLENDSAGALIIELMDPVAQAGVARRGRGASARRHHGRAAPPAICSCGPPGAREAAAMTRRSMRREGGRPSPTGSSGAALAALTLAFAVGCGGLVGGAAQFVVGPLPGVPAELQPDRPDVRLVVGQRDGLPHQAGRL